MKRSTLIFISAVFCFLKLSAEAPVPIELQGFYVGMTKQEVKTIYEKLKADAVAQHINIESETYRDRIMLDNESSSISNKIDIMYNEEGIANYITFEYKTVNILFDAAQMSAEELVKKVEGILHIPEMEFNDTGMVKTWSCIYVKEQIKVSVDESKNIRLQEMKK